MKMLPLLSKPRSLKLLDEVAKPFSPASKLIPGVLRSTSERLRPPCSRMTACGITVTVCGVSSNGAVCFGEAKFAGFHASTPAPAALWPSTLIGFN